MPVAVYLELYFLAIACAVAYLSVLHLRSYWKWAQVPESLFDMRLHRQFVRIQMWCSITFLCAFVPALAIGLYHTYLAPGLLSLLPLPFYFLPRLILAPAKPIEKELRSLTTDDPKAQEELDYIAYVWGHRLLPRF